MASFPPDLIVNRKGYDASIRGNAYSSDISGGLFYQRIDFDSSYSVVALEIRTNRSGMIVFKSFYDNDIHSGSAMFTISLDLGDGLSSHNARLSSPPSYNGDSDPVWVISVTMEVENMADIS